MAQIRAICIEEGIQPNSHKRSCREQLATTIEFITKKSHNEPKMNQIDTKPLKNPKYSFKTGYQKIKTNVKSIFTIKQGRGFHFQFR